MSGVVLRVRKATRRRHCDYPSAWSDEGQAVVRGPAGLVFDSFKLDVGQLMPRNDVSREAVHHCHLLLGHLNPATPVHGPVHSKVPSPNNAQKALPTHRSWVSPNGKKTAAASRPN